MTNPSQELLGAAQKLPLWQQDALRRITAGKLTEQDLAELVKLAKVESGHEILGAPTPVPLATTHLTGVHSAGGPVSLTALHSVQGVNALLPGQELHFSPQGLTVVYGENGAGKSGYSRILRKACRARTRPTILPNVIRQGPAATARAKFVVMNGLAEEVVEWSDGAAAPDLMARFAVFDRDCERSFVDDHGEAAFIPPAVSSFDELARVVDEVKRRIETEETTARPNDRLDDLLLKCSTDKLATEILAAAKPDLKDAEYADGTSKLEQLIWSDTDEAELTSAQRKLLESADPVSVAKGIRGLATSLKTFRTAAEPFAKSISDAAVDALKAAEARLKAATLAAAAASKHLDFSEEPASSVGGPEWQLLYQAAVKFALTSSEPVRHFPSAVEGSRCPLCLQVLDAPTQTRFEKFRQFMNNETRELADRAKEDLAKLREALERLSPHQLDPHIADQIGRALPAKVGATEALKQIGVQLISRRDAILKCTKSGTWIALSNFPAQSLELCIELEQLLEAKAVETEGFADPAARTVLTQTVAALIARKTAFEQRSRITGVLKQLREAARLRRTHAAINTRTISREGKAVAEKLLTGLFKATFEEELRLLGARDLIPASISPKGEKGKTVYGISIPGATTVSWKLSGVLSEGEQRVIALAYFLAETRLAPTAVGIILDDPVSSLDHRWAEKVAHRLATLARERQVIVFTHSIAFLIEVDRSATEIQAPLSRVFIARSSDGAGRCGPDAEPWERLNLKARVPALRKEVTELRSEFKDAPSGRKYARGAAQLCSDLRAAWERAVEEFVFNTAVERFGYAVSTGRLRRAVCTDKTFKLVNDAMTRLSAITEAHDKASGAFAACPTPDDLEGFIKDLEAFVGYQKAEADAVEKSRKVLEEPPVVPAPATVTVLASAAPKK